MKRLPRFFSTERTPWDRTIIHEHFFLAGCDWYVAEYDPKERLCFGYVILNNDHDNAEWGYFCFDELVQLRARGVFEVDRDLHWKPRPAGEIERIAQGQRPRGSN